MSQNTTNSASGLEAEAKQMSNEIGQWVIQKVADANKKAHRANLKVVRKEMIIRKLQKQLREATKDRNILATR